MFKLIITIILFSNLMSSIALANQEPTDAEIFATYLGCTAAITGENSTDNNESKFSLLICFKNDIIDQGLETETTGCSVRLYDTNEKSYIGFYNQKEVHDKQNMILVPTSCQNGGLEKILNYPIDNSDNLNDYIRYAFKKVKPLDISISKNKAVSELIQSIIQKYHTGTVVPEPIRTQSLPPDVTNQNTEIEVFFGSSRKYQFNDDVKKLFTDERTPHLYSSLGKVLVNIPVFHKKGNLELPSVFTVNTTPDYDNHFVLKSVIKQNSTTFFRQLKKRVGVSSKKDLFVFIHGFNNSFEEAALRTAQLAFDLKFEGAPVFYSWPSETILRYAIAEKNVEWTLPYITKFLKDIAQKSGSNKIHLIAHSMGNRALTQALNTLAQTASLNESQMFQSVILAAPDVDKAVFDKIDESIRLTTNSITLYASNNDRALQISKNLHDGQRLGESEPFIFLSKTTESIDASNVDTSFLGHSYYGDNPTVIDDIAKIINFELPASKRTNLVPVYKGKVKIPYWLLQN